MIFSASRRFYSVINLCQLDTVFFPQLKRNLQGKNLSDFIKSRTIHFEMSKRAFDQKMSTYKIEWSMCSRRRFSLATLHFGCTVI